MNLQNLQTPCFLLDEDELQRCLSGLGDALAGLFSRSTVSYSVKTNSLPFLLKRIADLGCYAEVVSYQEYELAIRCGFSKDRIIYNGPLKSKDTFLDAIENGAKVNIETWREIRWLKELPQDKQYGVGLRLNINISQVSSEDEASEEDDSRFGFRAETGEFQKAVAMISDVPNVSVKGIHTHREPRTRSVSFYQNVIRYTQHVLESMALQLEYWDLGGGFFGPMPDKPSFADYTKAFYDVMEPWARQLTVIVEPGNAIVASCFDYLAEVIDVKHHEDKMFITTDATRNDIDPFFRKSCYFHEIIPVSPVVEGRGKTSLLQVVGGLSCLEYDRLFTLPPGSEQLYEGDRILFHRVGAYTMTLSPLFIHFFPTIYVKSGDGFCEVRHEWTVGQMMGEKKL